MKRAHKSILISICVIIVFSTSFNCFAENPKNSEQADEKSRLDNFENAYRYSLTEEQKQKLLNKGKEKIKKEQEIEETGGHSYLFGDFFSAILGELIGEIFSGILSVPYDVVESLLSEGFTSYLYAPRKEVPDYKREFLSKRIRCWIFWNGI